MTHQAIARRYAAALFDVVQRTGALESAERDLASVRDLIASHDLLRQVLEAPAVAAPKKRAILERVLASADDVGAEVRRLLFLLADRGRLGLVGDVSAAFHARVLRARRVMPAEITSAVALGDGRRAALVDALGRATGNTVTMTERVNPALIGGFVAKVGGVVYDGSVSRQLERMRRKLLAEA